MIPIVYQDKRITITKDFIRIAGASSETISINQISTIEVVQKEKNNYRKATPLFIIVGLLTVTFGIGFLFLAWGIASWFYKEYTYTLQIDSIPGVFEIPGKKARLKSLAHTIHGLAFSKQQLATLH